MKHRESLESKIKSLSSNVLQSLERLAHREEEIKAAIANIKYRRAEEEKNSPRFQETVKGWIFFFPII